MVTRKKYSKVKLLRTGCIDYFQTTYFPRLVHCTIRDNKKIPSANPKMLKNHHPILHVLMRENAKRVSYTKDFKRKKKHHRPLCSARTPLLELSNLALPIFVMHRLDLRNLLLNPPRLCPNLGHLFSQLHKHSIASACPVFPVFCHDYLRYPKSI